MCAGRKERRARDFLPNPRKRAPEDLLPSESASALWVLPLRRHGTGSVRCGRPALSRSLAASVSVSWYSRCPWQVLRVLRELCLVRDARAPQEYPVRRQREGAKDSAISVLIEPCRENYNDINRTSTIFIVDVAGQHADSIKKPTEN